MIMSNSIRWISEEGLKEISTITKVETIFEIKFPKDYIECVMKNDGGYPMPNRFTLNEHEEVFNKLLSLQEVSYNIIDTYNNVKDRLINGVIPFAEDPFGNLLCFDYRKSKQPNIVFWDHEKAFINRNSALCYLCDSFSDLLLLLHDAQD
jgi:hypothetical protein